MGIESVLASIDAEISKLQQARALLAGGHGGWVSSGKKRGPKPRKKRVLSDEGRKRIAEAVKRRWARQKAAAKK